MMSPDWLKPPDEGSAFDRFGKEARIEARMLDPNTPITAEQRAALLKELKDYRNRSGSGDRAVPWADLGQRIGVSGSALLEVAQGSYAADDSNILRLIDQFLADETARDGRQSVRRFTPIRLTHKIKGAIEAGIKRNKIPVIIGEPGCGKSEHARWFVGQRPGAVYMVADNTDCDEKWVIDQLFKAFGLRSRSGRETARRFKKRDIVEYLRRHKNTVIVVDEAQFCTRSALEMFRCLHDQSDPTGSRCISIVLFGDHDFYKLIVRTRDGARTPISPQITRRMYPIFDIQLNGCDVDKHGNPIAGTVFSKSDIEATVRNARLKLLKPECIAWLTKLANTHGFGSLGEAMLVLDAALDLFKGDRVEMESLQVALTTVLGPDQAELVDEQTEHSLLARAAG